MDDRIEIENPGLLLFGLTIEDILQGVSKLRNRVIGRVFREPHLIEQSGSGMQRMTSACVEAGLAAPVFEEIGRHFRTTISSIKVRAPQAMKRTGASLTSCAMDKPAQPRQLRGTSDYPGGATLTRLKAMTSRGLLVEIGMGPHDPKRWYTLA